MKIVASHTLCDFLFILTYEKMIINEFRDHKVTFKAPLTTPKQLIVLTMSNVEFPI